MEIFSDLKIADRVRSALQRDSFILRSDIGVVVAAGKVHLSGKVESYFDSLRADELASRVDGVVQVQNNLLINDPATRKTDGEISDEIQKQLWRTPIVHIEAAAISVRDGVATLAGVVESLRELEFAREKAYEAGAKRVQNYLEVRE